MNLLTLPKGQVYSEVSPGKYLPVNYSYGDPVSSTIKFAPSRQLADGAVSTAVTITIKKNETLANGTVKVRNAQVTINVNAGKTFTPQEIADAIYGLGNYLDASRVNSMLIGAFPSDATGTQTSNAA